MREVEFLPHRRDWTTVRFPFFAGFLSFWTLFGAWLAGKFDSTWDIPSWGESPKARGAKPLLMIGPRISDWVCAFFLDLLALLRPLHARAREVKSFLHKDLLAVKMP